MPVPVLVTAPTDEPVTTTEAKAHLRVDISDDDAYIDDLVGAARELIEKESRRAYITQTWDLFMDGFPPFHNRARATSLREYWKVDRDTIFIPSSPLISVTTFTYIDSTGVTKTLVEGTDFKIDVASEPGRIVPEFNTTWPTARDEINSVKIRFIAGFGAAADVPKRLKHAIKLLIGNWYENRESNLVGITVNDLPKGLRSLIWSLRIGTDEVFV